MSGRRAMDGPASELRLSPRERLVVWLVTGPVGRAVGFVAEAAVALWSLLARRIRW